MKKRWLYLVMGMLILLLSGMIYSWSVISTPIREEYPMWNEMRLGFTYTLTILFFSTGQIVGGKLNRILSARKCMIAAAVLYSLAFICMSRATTLTAVYIFFGVCSGMACGMAYIAVLSSVVMWFPDRKGLATGLLLMSFGVSSSVIGKIYQLMSDRFMWRNTFVIMAAAYLILMLIAGRFIMRPSDGPANTEIKAFDGIDIPPGEMVKTLSFWALVLWLIALPGSGMMITSQLGNVMREIDPATSFSFISSVSMYMFLANGCGRVTSGLIYDRIGRKFLMGLIDALFCVTPILMLISLYFHTFTTVILAVVLMGWAYGSVSTCESSYLSSRFGMKYYNENLPLANANLYVTAFSSTLAGAMFDRMGTYQFVYVLMLLLSVTAIVCTVLITVNDRKHGFVEK